MSNSVEFQTRSPPTPARLRLRVPRRVLRPRRSAEVRLLLQRAAPSAPQCRRRISLTLPICRLSYCGPYLSSPVVAVTANRAAKIKSGTSSNGFRGSAGSPAEGAVLVIRAAPPAAKIKAAAIIGKTTSGKTGGEMKRVTVSTRNSATTAAMLAEEAARWRSSPPARERNAARSMTAS